MKLSIITINYNNAAGLEKTIQSVIFQSYTDFEYIVIDGGSADGSVDIIKQYANKISYWVSEPDKGIYNAMNKGILQAKGEYLLFMNSGDYLVDENVLSSVFSKEQIKDIINGDHIRKYPDKEIPIKSLAFENNGTFTLFNLLDGYINHQSTFIKKELFDKYGLYDESYKIVADWFFFLNVIGLQGCSFEYIDLPICYFDMNGICINQTELHQQERERGMVEILPDNVHADYKKYRELHLKYYGLEKKGGEFDYLFKYKFTYFIARSINKMIRLFFNKIP